LTLANRDEAGLGIDVGAGVAGCCRACAAVTIQSVPLRTIALRATSSLRMQATIMTFGFLPASRAANAAIKA
jgi:hypothetical protein